VGGGGGGLLVFLKGKVKQLTGKYL